MSWSEEPFHALPHDTGLYRPVASASGVAGVLTVDGRPDGRPYGAADMRLFDSLADFAATFLGRQRLEVAAASAQAEQMKSNLLSSVSHELKTPLTSLIATVTHLLEGDLAWDENMVRGELRSIATDATRLNRDIGELLDLSRLEAHAWEPRSEPCELSDVIYDSLQVLPASDLPRLVVDLPPDLPAVEIDFVQWSRVFQSLIENALQYIELGKDPFVLFGRHTRTAVLDPDAKGRSAHLCLDQAGALRAGEGAPPNVASLEERGSGWLSPGRSCVLTAAPSTSRM